jgi:hypothetical protein
MGLKGWFIKGNEGEADPSAEIDKIMKESGMPQPERPSVRVPPGPSAGMVMPVGTEVPQPPADPTVVSESEIYIHAHLAGDKLERNAKVVQMMKDLSALPEDSRRAAVTAAISAFGIQPNEVVQTSYNQIQALDGWSRMVAQHTAGVVQNYRSRIENLRSQMQAAERSLQQAEESQRRFDEKAKNSKEAINRVIAFFTGNPK